MRIKKLVPLVVEPGQGVSAEDVAANAVSFLRTSGISKQSVENLARDRAGLIEFARRRMRREMGQELLPVIAVR